jgi:hypothetical protein
MISSMALAMLRGARRNVRIAVIVRPLCDDLADGRIEPYFEDYDAFAVYFADIDLLRDNRPIP